MKPYNWPKTNLSRLLLKKHLERKGYFFLQIFTHCDVNTGVQKLWISTKCSYLVEFEKNLLKTISRHVVKHKQPKATLVRCVYSLSSIVIVSFFFTCWVTLHYLQPAPKLVHTILCYVGSPSKTSPRYLLRCSRNVLCPIFRVSFHRLIFRPIFERPLYMIRKRLFLR